MDCSSSSSPSFLWASYNDTSVINGRRMNEKSPYEDLLPPYERSMVTTTMNNEQTDSTIWVQGGVTTTTRCMGIMQTGLIPHLTIPLMNSFSTSNYRILGSTGSKSSSPSALTHPRFKDPQKSSPKISVLLGNLRLRSGCSSGHFGLSIEPTWA